MINTKISWRVYGGINIGCLEEWDGIRFLIQLYSIMMNYTIGHHEPKTFSCTTWGEHKKIYSPQFVSVKVYLWNSMLTYYISNTPLASLFWAFLFLNQCHWFCAPLAVYPYFQVKSHPLVWLVLSYTSTTNIAFDLISRNLAWASWFSYWHLCKLNQTDSNIELNQIEYF